MPQNTNPSWTGSKMYVERHQYELTKSQILEKAHLNSSDDIVLLSGSRAAGLEHEHSDYDAVVVTTDALELLDG